MINKLLTNKENKEILIEYLSDTAKENLMEGRIKHRY